MSIPSKTYHQNPNIDILFGFYGGGAIPTKQESFKPIIMQEEGTEKLVDGFYLKNPDKKSINEFNEYFNKLCSKNLHKNGKILKQNTVEVILRLSIVKNRINEVDVDNLSKTLLDGMKGIIFEDDSQVSSLIVHKYVHKMNINAAWIGVTQISNENTGYGFGIELYRPDKW